MGRGYRISAEERAEKYLAVVGVLDNSHIKVEDFENLVYPLRNAVKRAGLKLTSGRILFKNNLCASRILFFPESATLYQFEFQEPTVIWNDVHLVRAEYQRGSRKYKIEKLEEIDMATSSELLTALMNNVRNDIAESTKGKRNEEKRKLLIRAKAIIKLMDKYVFELFNLGICSENARELFSPTKFRKKSNVLRNFSEFDAYRELFEEDFDDIADSVPKHAIKVFIWTRIESLLFASTLFSLCKPLFGQCSIKNAHSQFALQIDLKGCCIPSGNGDESYVLSSDGNRVTEQVEIVKAYHHYWALNSFIHLWCDFDITKDHRPSKQEETHPYISDMKLFRKFRRRWSDTPRSASWVHLYFPLVYSDYHKSQWGNEIRLYEELPPQEDKKHYPDKEWVKGIGQMLCLPILLFLNPPPKPYPESDCLSVEYEFPAYTASGGRMPNLYDLGHNHHEKIKALYYKFLQLLCGKEYKEVKRSLQKSYDEALQTVGASLKEPAIDLQHKACILGSLYFARDVFQAAGIEDRYTQIERHIEQIEKFFGRLVTTADFAEFLSKAVEKDSFYHSAVLLQDPSGIYLKWGDYWHDFEHYCKECNITLNCTELQFRKRHLVDARYLRPQYQVVGQKKYPRYDYRKKIGGKTETVLNVDPQILRLVK